MAQLGLQGRAVIPSYAKITRREYRGNRQRVQLDAQHTYRWVKSFERVLPSVQGDCDQVFEELEPRIEKFGYSFYNLKRVAPTLFLQPFALKDAAI